MNKGMRQALTPAPFSGSHAICFCRLACLKSRSVSALRARLISMEKCMVCCTQRDQACAAKRGFGGMRGDQVCAISRGAAVQAEDHDGVGGEIHHNPLVPLGVLRGPLWGASRACSARRLEREGHAWLIPSGIGAILRPEKVQGRGGMRAAGRGPAR